MQAAAVRLTEAVSEDPAADGPSQFHQDGLQEALRHTAAAAREAGGKFCATHLSSKTFRIATKSEDETQIRDYFIF